MSRTHARPAATRELKLDALQDRCGLCDEPLWVAYHSHRKVLTLDGLLQLILPVRRCAAPPVLI